MTNKGKRKKGAPTWRGSAASYTDERKLGLCEDALWMLTGYRHIKKPRHLRRLARRLRQRIERKSHND